MKIPNGATVIVADGRKVRLFRQEGQAEVELKPLPEPSLSSDTHGSGGRHQSSAANPDDDQQEEDALAAGLAAWVNREVASNRLKSIVVAAAPRTLGELRQHWTPGTKAALVQEIAKDFGNHDLKKLEQALSGA